MFEVDDEPNCLLRVFAAALDGVHHDDLQINNSGYAATVTSSLKDRGAAAVSSRILILPHPVAMMVQPWP